MLKKISAKKSLIADTPAEALQMTPQAPLRIVCGSLYLAGEFLSILVPEQDILNI
jgi:folylpolyglutamate synthase/dihydropteroate synthase